MAQYISKSAVVEEIEKRKHKLLDHIICESDKEWVVRTAHQLNRILLFLDTLEVKELASIAYVVTRCEEHSDYVEEVFFDEDRAQEYCDQFKGNENEYARHITKVKVTL